MLSDQETPSPLAPSLEQEHQLHRRRRRHKGRFRILRRFKRRLMHLNWKITLLVVVGVSASLIMGVLVLVTNARNQVESSWESLDRVLSEINNKPGTELTLEDFQQLQAGMRDLDSSLSTARKQTFLLRPFKFLSADLAVALDSLDVAQELTQAANAMLDGAEPTFRFLTESEAENAVEIQLSSGERVVELLRLGRGKFLNAQAQLDATQKKIDLLNLADVSVDLFVTVDSLSQRYDQIQELNSLLLDSPELLTAALGLEDTETYLVLAQNSDELRPSGGYISTYGWMTVRNGRIVDYDYSPTTATSPNPPPAQMASEIEVPDWWIAYGEPIYAAWDGSWYADFPATAEMAAWYYDNGDNPQSPVDGVIGIDMVGFEYILGGLGSVTLPEYNVIVSPENFRDVVYEIRAEGEGDLPHKRFVAALYKQILADWRSVDSSRSADVRRAVFQALQEKHIMIYFTGDASSLNKAADDLGWAGKQDPGTQYDYLMVADANLGSKSSRSVIRQLTYDVEILSDGSLNSRASVAYDFSAQVAESDPAVRPAHYTDINYHTMLQLFAPVGSQLDSARNFDIDPTQVSTETHTIYVSLVQIDYDSSERYQLTYSTPVLVEKIGPYRRYKLLLQKQPGTLNENVSVTIKLPAGASVQHTSPEPDASYTLEQPVLEFRVNLTTDEWIEVIYQ